MGKQGQVVSIADRLRKIECHLDSLDAAVQELHPEYSSHIVMRVTELEDKRRSHASSVFKVLNNQRLGVETAAMKASKTAADACARLDQASQRHELQAAMLRREVGSIKDMVDLKSEQCARDLANMELLVKETLENIERQDTLRRQADAQIEQLTRWEVVANEVRASLQDLKFQSHKAQRGCWDSPAATRGRVSSVPALIRHAQKMAESRSPSSRHESCKQKRVELTRAASQQELWTPNV